MNTSIPRPEHPRPQFFRKNWLNLNGTWTIRLDPGKSGLEQGWQNSRGFETGIRVPFCPESELSGVHHTDFIEAIWYHRSITVPTDWQDSRILLHFGGVDYECEIFIDGVSVGMHTGGTVSFTLDITRFVQPGVPAELVLHVTDDTRGGCQPLGKQSVRWKSAGCSYTRTTGIWQTVWLEKVSPQGLKKCRIIPDIDRGMLIFIPEFHSLQSGNALYIQVSSHGEICARTALPCSSGIPVELKIPSPVLWEPGKPHLYDVHYEVRNAGGELLDSVESYAGLRKCHVEGNRFYLNNQPVFLRLVLDQGFYPKGIWTAPSDEDLKQDIELSMKAGFNGARLHQKVFEERFHYWADRMGYLTWGEFPDWGLAFWDHSFGVDRKVDHYRGFCNHRSEWAAAVDRDFNHPSIIAWTPFNETAGYWSLAEHRRVIAETVSLTRQFDPTRPVNDSSGYIHVDTDLWTVHHYEQDARKLAAALCPADQPVYCVEPQNELPAYHGQPYIVDEYGGVRFIPEDRSVFADNSWGYGSDPASRTEALGRIRDQTNMLVDLQNVGGYCYTQLTDIEQEQNGIYNYDRTPKFDMDEIHRIFSRKPDWSKY